MTAGRAASGPRAVTPKAPRRAPMDLTIAFADEATVRERVAVAGEPDWLLADRLAALGRADALPVETNRLYTLYVDLRNADLEAARPYLDPAADVAAGGDAAANLPAGADGLIELREDAIPVCVLSDAARAAGVRLEPLAALAPRDPVRFREVVEGGSILPDEEKLAQLVRALWTTGIHLDVPDGVALERPIVLRTQVGDPGRAVISRTIVTLGAGARASVVEDLLPSGPEIGCAAGETVPQSLHLATTEVRLGADADLQFASLQDFTTGTIAFQTRSSALGDRASLRWALAQVGGRVAKSRVDNRLAGDGSSVEQVEIVFGSDDQLFDLTSYTRHVGEDTTGLLTSKAAMLDRSRSYIKGLTSIERSAHGTDSYLGEFGMLLSKEARSVTIPSLEIDQPDCRRAGHGSSVGPIDTNQLFYLESRGIDPDAARKFIVLGFLEPVVARVPLEAERDRLRDLLEEKWAKAVAVTAAA
jgi:Fe-S cluster assembly protein SufB